VTPARAASADPRERARFHYYLTHGSINPSGIVPGGPAIDVAEPHGRG